MNILESSLIKQDGITILLSEILNYRAQYQSDKQAYIFLANGETPSGCLTYGELDRQARAIAAYLQSWQGERALLLYASGLEFITAFFGCLYADVVAVPAYLPKRNQKLSRLLSIVNDAQAKIALTSTSVLADLKKRCQEETELAQLKLVATDNIEANTQDFILPSLTPSSLAFLQYTSGSTGTPKGVMVTHGNIIHNQQLIQQAFGHSEESIVVGWLPLFHDMGLIGNVLQPMYLGISCILMPPVAFLQKPIRWLQAISQYRATTSGGPNFAYDLCVSKVKPEQLANLDLSSWDLAFNGAEPIKAETMEQFSKKFAPCGFKANAFYPCYGMAETTLFTTGGDKKQLPVIQGVKAGELEQNLVVETEISSPESRVFVGCGYSCLDTKVVIVNPDSLTSCVTGQVGEIWVSGGSVASGYWHRPQVTQETFQAYLKDTGEGPFLRTGDLGFVKDGELFFTGRLKDLIIIRGQNHYPQDIELTVENSHPSLKAHASAAFSVEIAGEELLVVACEVERTYLRKLNTEDVVQRLRKAISEQHDLQVYAVVLLKTGSIPKTSSGKIQRHACRIGFLNGSLDVVGEGRRQNPPLTPPRRGTGGRREESLYGNFCRAALETEVISEQVQHPLQPLPSQSEIEAWLVSYLARHLNILPDKIDLNSSFADYGLDSSVTVSATGELSEWLGYDLDPTLFWEYPSLKAVALYLTEFCQALQQKDNRFSADYLPLVPVERNQKSPLSYQQERLWYVAQLIPDKAALNIAQAVRIQGLIDIQVLQNSWKQIVSRQEILRTSFALLEDSLVQVSLPELNVAIAIEDYPDVNKTEIATVIENNLNQAARKSFALTQAPLWSLKLLKFSETDSALIVVFHHIISDALSLNLLIQELLTLYDASLANRQVPLTELDIQYGDYAVWQRQRLQGYLLARGLSYWQKQLAGISSLYPVPVDHFPVSPSWRSRQKTFLVPTTTLSGVEQLSSRYSITPVVVLLAVFYVLIAQYSLKQDIVVGFPVSGRLHHKLQAAIGFFADVILLRAHMAENLTFKELLDKVKEITVEAYANQHIPLNYVAQFVGHQTSQQYRNLFQVLFDYIDLGNNTQNYANFTSTTLAGTLPTDIDLFFALLKTNQEISGLLTYNANLFEEDTITAFIDSYLSLLEQCLNSPEIKINELVLSEKLKGRQAEIHSQSRKQALVETALTSLPEVQECATLTRDNQLVAYLVVAGNFSREKIHLYLQSHLSPELLPSAYVPVSALPRTALGQVDKAVLASLEVIDSDLIARWEEKLRSHPQIAQAAVIVQPKKGKVTPPVHILDLLPKAAIAGIFSEETRQKAEPTPNPSKEGNRGQKGFKEGNREEFEDASQPENLTTVVPAFSDGGLLTIPEDAPLTLTEALIQTATRYQQKEIVYILAPKQQVSQTYGSLLAEAKCILNGLRHQGLTAGDRIILQIECLRDYFPALWGCILGGIQPVTVAVAKTYQQPNAVVKKLYNTWELLEHPPILASESLLEPLQNMQQLLPLSGVQVLSVQRMINYPATAEIYHSQPDDIAFLQLTSGSTGVPKCIPETHQGIVAHIHAAQQFNGYQAEDISLNWLPVDHVVPILTCHFKDTYLGCQQIEVATDVVLANPIVWLDLMAKYRVSHTWTPNFGCKLVSDALSKVPYLSWDLSAVKFFMNAGEQVTPQVVREFLQLVAPFGVTPQAMQPAFGMAEVCTCMTYQNQFDTTSAIHRLQKSSLGGQLVKAEATDTDVIEFTDLGAPVPGVQIRITDEHNQLLPEGVIGRFQIKGKVVTPGYLHNPQANSEAFVGDGWFNSGDLGFILDGKLVLTGREKELIIINGVNYYCYEIEDIVNNLEGVEPTFSGAVSFSQPETGTEGLAIFFTPKRVSEKRGGETSKKTRRHGDAETRRMEMPSKISLTPPKQEQLELNLELSKTIRREVSSQLGITPTYVIPLSKAEFPKTTSGKIQRGRLKRMLEAGECQAVIKAIDIQLANNRTIPNWFYQKSWRFKEASVFPYPPQVGLTLILVDDLGLGRFLSEKLEKAGQSCIQVAFGNDFAQVGDRFSTAVGNRNYTIAPGNRQHYRELLESITTQKTPISRILHLGTYQDYTEVNRESLEQAQNQGLYSLLHLVQALEQVQGTQHQVQLLFISSYTQSIQPTDKIAYEKATVLGLLKTIPQEMPWLSCTHLDLPMAEVEINGNYIWQELCNFNKLDREIAYREGKRLVSCLELVDLASQEQQELPLKQGGIYLITGGLGGIGVEIAQYILEHYQARLILVGRTELEQLKKTRRHGDTETRRKEILEKGGDKLSEKMLAYQKLQQLPGEVVYRAVDIGNLEQLQQVVTQTVAQWGGTQLDGVIHLAGIYHEQLLSAATQDNIATLLHPKVIGTWVLHQLVKDNADALFIHFSSIYGFFGATALAAYSAANSLQTAFCDYQKTQGNQQTYCLAWSIWDETGMSRGYQMQSLSRAKGYYTITPSQGMYSLLAALSHKHHNLLVGLDKSNSQIQRWSGDCQSLQQLTAYFVAKTTELLVEQLLELELRDRFGTISQIMPAAFVQLEAFPLTADGKIDRKRLREPDKITVSDNETQEKIAAIWREVLQLEEVGIDDNFFELGGTSILLIQVHSKLQEIFELKLKVVDLLAHPTINSLSQLITGDGEAQSTKQRPVKPLKKPQDKRDIAIIGMSGRFPGAKNLEEFWENLKNGVESISYLSDQQLVKSGISTDLLNNPHYVKVHGLISDIDLFDADFFNYSPREAKEIDPQQRLFLECAWEAIESSGYNPQTYEGSIGVYAGGGMPTYLMSHLGNQGFILLNNRSFERMIGNDKDYLATRTAYKLNLTGPAINVQTACSTSLVAVHLACQSLLNGECHLALAGGVSIQIPQEVGYLYQQGMIASPDGHCRAFDARARGTILGSGVGVVLLKPLQEAIADGDCIQAVIKGSAINNDGSLKLGYTAPSVEGQIGVISQAQAVAGVEPETITYIEAHGTGTELGDPIEIEALTKSFKQQGNSEKAIGNREILSSLADELPLWEAQNKQFCAIGSVKTNVGHLNTAAGVTSLIKTVLALKHGLIPPSLNFEQPNPQIDFANSPFYVNTSLSEWKSNGSPRRAGVSSFGVGGTNAHLVLEEAPKEGNRQQPTGNSEDYLERSLHILTLSAKTQKALEDLVSRYHHHLTTNPELPLADICYTANTGRAHFNHRLAVVAANQAELIEKLLQFPGENQVPGICSGELSEKLTATKVAFLFTGQGSQYVNMARKLYEQAPVFRKALEQCQEILLSTETFQKKSLLEILYPANQDEYSSSLLEQTAYTQPALFAIEYALFKLWQSWGIKPDIVMGHSVGEYVAATVAGVWSLADGLQLIAARGRLMQQLPTGSEMVSVIASAAKVRTLLEPYRDKVAIAAINGPESTVISGESQAVKAIANQLASAGIKTKPLQVSHAFHSPLMAPMLAEFEALANQLTYHQPQIPIISNLTGTIADNSITTAQYWINHVRQPVRFADSMRTLHQSGYELFLEIGPKPVLLAMGRQCLPQEVGVWLPSLRPGVDEWQLMLSSLGQLYVQGAPVNWLRFDQNYARQRVVLPTYPFQRQSYWLETPENEEKFSREPENSYLVKLLNQGDVQELNKYLTTSLNLSAQELELLPTFVEKITNLHQQEINHLSPINNQTQTNAIDDLFKTDIAELNKLLSEVENFSE